MLFLRYGSLKEDWQISQDCSGTWSACQSLPENSRIPYPARNDLAKSARYIFVKLFWKRPSQEPEDEENNETAAVTNEEPREKISRYEELNAIICSRDTIPVMPKVFTTPQEILTFLKREMSVFDATGARTDTLEKIYDALCTLPPTSVEAERAFSAAGIFITKLRCSLNDLSVDMLCFLRSYFLKQGK
jgi:hypothetical protein